MDATAGVSCASYDLALIAFRATPSTTVDQFCPFWHASLCFFKR